MPAQPVAPDVLDAWWSEVPAHQRRALARHLGHPLPHTLARALLAVPGGAALLELRGQGERARYVLGDTASAYVAERLALVAA